MHATCPDELVGIVTFDDSADTRHALGDLQQFGRTHRLPVTVVATRAEADRAIRDAAPDMVVVCGWYWMSSSVVVRYTTEPGVHARFSPTLNGRLSTSDGMPPFRRKSSTKFRRPRMRESPPVSMARFIADGLVNSRLLGATASSTRFIKRLARVRASPSSSRSAT